MNPVEKAIWYIESHSADEIGLDDIASVVGVSSFHLIRAFGAVTGMSVMRYLRARRLSEAAKLLADGRGTTILDVAIGAGYGSHEAFTRAFRQQFGIVPEMLRDPRALETIQLMEPIMMNEQLLENLRPPRFVDGKAMLLAGLRERYTRESSAGIPAQWQRFNAYMGHIPNAIGKAAYGALYNADEACNIDYLSGVEVRRFDDLPAEFDRLRIPAARYAVFRHEDHISSIRQTWATIFGKWFPQSDYEIEDAPEFERYDETFDPKTGLGGFEIWIPVRAKK